MKIEKKEDIISLVLEQSKSYIDGSLLSASMGKDIYLSTRQMKLWWDYPIADIDETQKVRRKINRDFKSITDKKERAKLNDFVMTVIGQGLPKNSYYTNADFGFNFKKNKFELFLDGKEFNEPILCIGTDEHYDFFVVSPAFKGVRKVFHDMGEIIEIGYDNIDDFAQTMFKFAIIEGAINKKLLCKDDVEGFFDDIKNEKLKEILKEHII